VNNVLDRLQSEIADRYVIQREVGRGGMAIVYLAHDVRHDRAVAVKVLRPELGVLLGAERFLREIRVVARLHHPHILPVHDSGEVDGALYYVMPFVEGASLRDRLRKEHWLPITEAARIACDVAGALDLAHRRGVVHRDIKPGNILFVDGHAVVADFGIARAVHAAGGEMWETITDSGVALGTPAYMSPEQSVGAATLDARADIYSLGCVLYEMLVGEPPFIGPGGEVLVTKRFAEDAPLVSVARPDAPSEVDRAVARALARNAGDRFATAREFMDALAPVATTGQTIAQNVAYRPSRTPIARPAALAVASIMVAAAAMFVWLSARPGSEAPTRTRDTFAISATQPSAPQIAATPPTSEPSVRDSAALRTPSAANVPDTSTKQPAANVPTSKGREPARATSATSTEEAMRAAASFQRALNAANIVRQRAVIAGATAAELARGDSLATEALSLAAQARYADAMGRVAAMDTSVRDAEAAASARRAQEAQPAPVPPAPTPPVPRATAPRETLAISPAPVADPRVEISAVLSRYARALESRDVQQLQTAYPGLTPTQRQSWERFFRDVREMHANLTIDALDVKGDAADARVSGRYEYSAGSGGRSETQRVAFRATFRREAGIWRLAAVSQ